MCARALNQSHVYIQGIMAKQCAKTGHLLMRLYHMCGGQVSTMLCREMISEPESKGSNSGDSEWEMERQILRRKVVQISYKSGQILDSVVICEAN